MPATESIRVVLVDSHVHIHDCFPLTTFLDRAWNNLASAARAVGVEQFAGVLLLAEAEGEDAFGRLGQVARSGTPLPQAGRWSFESTAEASSIRATAAGGRALWIVAGRQVAAAEDLEVLLLGTEIRPEERLPIRELLRLGEEAGAIRVIPWGAGKWFFERGRLVGEILRCADPGGFCLGDEGGRPWFWPAPGHFAEAHRMGVRVLPGTDPLPFPREIGRAGSYGFRAEAPFDPEAPSRSIRSIVANRSVRLEGFGRREGLVGFVRNQVAMQIRKRRRAGERRRTGQD